MFYQFKESMVETDFHSLDKDLYTIGYVSADELEAIADNLGFAASTVAACRNLNENFRSGVEIYDNYTFTELRIIGENPEDDDFVALYFTDKMMLVVDVQDKDNSTKDKLFAGLRRLTVNKGAVTLEKIIYVFLDQLVSGEIKVIEDIGKEFTALEEDLLTSDIDDDFNVELFRYKKNLLRHHYYYEQILDITETVEEDENDLFEKDTLMYITNLSRRVERLREDSDTLRGEAEHLQDAYYSYMDGKRNQTMKLLTVITTIFFPLTIIVGWYGMNFTTMPELTWQYGYIFVIILSAVVVLGLTILGKIRKWF